MTGKPPDDPSANEREEFASLRSRPEPSPSLEERTVRSLRRRGLIEERAGSVWATPLGSLGAVIAAALLFAAGLATQRYLLTPGLPAHDSSAFLLLLWEPVDRPLAANEEEEARLVEEYGAWARSEAESGRLIAAEKLVEEGRVLRRAQGRLDVEPASIIGGAEKLGGYFVIRAAGLTQAVEIASTCPHLDHAGTIELRQLERR